MTNIQSGTQFFDELLGDIDTNQNYASHKLIYRVGCIKMRAPRDPMWEYLIDMGRGHLNDIFDSKIISAGSLTFVFPERWLGVHEQQRFVSALEDVNGSENITQVDIITSSPMIISGFHREQIRILTWDDDDKYNGITKADKLRDKITP
jgi:hypothetical protein